MKNSKRVSVLTYILVATVAGFVTNEASAQLSSSIAIAIPKNGKGVKKPSSDVVINGKVIDAGALAKKIEQGFDSSVYNPVENKLWQNKIFPTSDAKERGYPAGDAGVKFVSFEGSIDGQNVFFRVQNAQGVQFRMTISRFSQPMMMRSALLRKLGYFVASPQYYSRLKVNFTNADEKTQFLQDAQTDLRASFEDHKWVTEEVESSLVLTSATLEIPTSDTYDFYWGMGPSPETHASTLAVLSKNRAYRALIMPFSLVDVPESINRYGVKMVSVMKGFATLNYWMATSFAAADYEDSRWILRKMAALSYKDLTEVVANSGYPAEVQPLVLAKMISRLNSALEAFKIPQQILSVDLQKINSQSGFVKAGKVTKEYYPGIPQRLSHPVSDDQSEFDARRSPFQDGDLGRYLDVFTKSSVLETAIGRLNQKLQALTVEQAAKNYQKEMIDKLIDQLKNRPNEPMYREVTSWGGPMFGANVSATRNISTGTYSGSTAPVQLVDNVSVGVGVGVFRALDGLDNWMPAMGANVSMVRDYTHVRPILSVKEGSKENWANLVVPRFMSKLAKGLKSESIKDKDGVEVDSMDAFFKDLRDGEVFTITDSIALTTYLQTTSSLDVLLGITPFNFVNSVTLGADANRVILRQVQIVKVGRSLQVFVREMKNRGQGLQLSSNFFLEILKIRAQMSDASIRSDAFVIEYSPDRQMLSSEESAKMDEMRSKMKLAFIPLLRGNNTELLYSEFKDRQFNIQHELKTKETKLKFLAWKFSGFKEDHTVKIQYPMNPDYPELNPKDEEVILFASKKGELVGRDILGLAFDVFDGILTKTQNNNITLTKSIGDNPANVPFGRAHWKIIDTEADLSTFRTPYESVAMIDYVWGGWSMKREKFMKIMDDIEAKFASMKIAGFKMIDRQEFNNVESLDFYRINAHVTFTASGLTMLKNLFVQPKVAGDSKNRKAKDWAFFTEYKKMLGRGNEKAGEDLYYKICRKELGMRTAGWQPPEVFRANNYECMTRNLHNILSKADGYPTDKKAQTQWMTEMISLLEKDIEISAILNYLGEKNYIAFVKLNGFRPGDEDGDLEYFSNVMGDPETEDPQSNGLINMFTRKTRILPTELDRTQGSFQ